MQAPIPTSAPVATAGTNCPSTHPESTVAQRNQPALMDDVGQERHSHSPKPCGDLELLNRVGRVVQDISAGRAVSDAELLAHEADCRRLSESTYDRFQATGNPADREEAVLWLARATEARKCLSPAFKQAREAQIQQAIAEGTGCYFMDQADAARARVGGRR